MKLTITLAQIDIAFGNPEANLITVTKAAEEAARRGSNWLVLPELWSTAYDLENASDYATPTTAGIFTEVAALAKKHQLHIVGSCLSDLGDGTIGNTATWHDAAGVEAGRYSKLHLFRLMDEHKFLAAGDVPTLVSTDWGKVGMGICYDLRFPELFRHYALQGATMAVLPSEWPHPRLMHWRTLMRARAIENQLFMIACNRVGQVGDTTFFGHSAIVDPWGETVIEGGEGEMLLTADIDFGRLPSIRDHIPIFTDRRPDVYELGGNGK